jgi:hypothetical protein
LATSVSAANLALVPDQLIDQLKELLATPTPPALGPQSRPGVMPEAALNARLAELFTDRKISPRQQALIRSLLLLWHDHLDASHNISQGIENADGSFVHAIMHRREPDYWNAKYWWRRVGAHPAFPEIARRVSERFAGSRRREEADLAKQLLPGGDWDACAFVDACEAAAGAAEREALLREVQRIETEVLLESFLS